MQTLERIEPAWRTRSLYAAAFLLSCGFPLLDTESDTAGRTEFLIGGEPTEVRARLRDYRSGSALVNAQRFGSELRRLKAVLHGAD